MGAPNGRRVPEITLRVACAQLRARPVEEANAALRDILAAIAKAKRARAELVVLPECAYPGYVLLDRNPFRRGIPTAQAALTRVAAAAARQGIHVVLGIARPSAAGLQNQAVLIDDHGRELGSYAKSYLWSFDNRWFARGRSLPVMRTRFGSVGMLICADGRVPELCRGLTAQGAWLLLDPTAWVSYGPTFEAMANPQADYMLRVRALESGAWIAAADKCGSEHDAIYYVGRSQIVAPDGRVVSMASTASPELIVAELHKRRARRIFAATSRVETLPAGRRSSLTAGTLVWLGVYQAPRPRSRRERLTLRTLHAQGASAIVRTDASSAALRSALRDCQPLRTALIEGRAMAAPESARAAARAGVDMLVWTKPPRNLPVLDIARTRALESRVYVLVSARPRPDVSACLVDPDGVVVASALLNAPSAFLAPVDVAAARRKLVVPGTFAFEPSVAAPR